MMREQVHLILTFFFNSRAIGFPSDYFLVLLQAFCKYSTISRQVGSSQFLHLGPLKLLSSEGTERLFFQESESHLH